jgi:alpha-beta hydrolase superfamily lysophospholipase
MAFLISSNCVPAICQEAKSVVSTTASPVPAAATDSAKQTNDSAAQGAAADSAKQTNDIAAPGPATATSPDRSAGEQAAAAPESIHQFAFKEDAGAFKDLHVPVYEWLPTDVAPGGMVLAIHGLTLHGTSYELVAKSFAAGGYYFVASDMRGFGKCNSKFSPAHEYCVDSDCKWKVDYDKSYDDIVAIAQIMKHQYPNIALTVMGESLGATLAVRIAAEHPELVDRMILSAPAVKLNPLMFLSPNSISSGLYALFISPKFHMSLKGFINHLVSNNANISKEMMDDKLIRKDLSLADLMKTQDCVEKTIKYARLIHRSMPILIVQGSIDHCVIPDDVVQLSSNTHSGDQTLRWLDNTGHLLLETHYVKAGTIAAISDWFDDHEPAHLKRLKDIQSDIQALGGKIDD